MLRRLQRLLDGGERMIDDGVDVALQVARGLRRFEHQRPAELVLRELVAAARRGVARSAPRPARERPGSRAPTAPGDRRRRRRETEGARNREVHSQYSHSRANISLARASIGRRSPGLERDLVRRRQVALEGRLHPGAELRPEDDGRQLLVVQEAAPVEVGRADRRPDAVDHGRLGVQQGVAPLVDLARRRAAARRSATRPAWKTSAESVVLGTISLTSTPRATASISACDQLRVGDEVGVGEQDLALGAVDRRDQGHVDLAERVVGRAADRTHDLLALRRQRPGSSRAPRAAALLARPRSRRRASAATRPPARR